MLHGVLASSSWRVLHTCRIVPVYSPLIRFLYIFGAAEERIEGVALEDWLDVVVAPMELAAFIRGDYVVPAEQLSTS